MEIIVLKPMVISIVQEVLIRKWVQEEIRKLEDKFFTWTWNSLLKQRTLKLKLSDKVSDTRTGGVLEGINDKRLKLALLDSNGDVVTCGDAASAEVEIHLIDNGNNHEDNMTHENFVRSIIPAGEKKKPHFAKRVLNLSRMVLGT